MKQQFTYFLLFILICFPAHVFAETLVISTAVKEDTFVFKNIEKLFEKLSTIAKVTLRLKHLPLKRSFVYLKTGKTAGDWGRMSERYENDSSIIQVPEILTTLPVSAFYKKNIEIMDVSSLKSYKTVFRRGSTVALKNIFKELSNVSPVLTIDEGMAKILSGETDVFVTADININLYCKKHDCKKENIKKSKTTFISVPIYLFLHKSKEKWGNPLAKAIHQLKENGEFAKLFPAKIFKWR